MREDIQTYPHFHDRRVEPVFESYHRLFVSALCVRSYIQLAPLIEYQKWAARMSFLGTTITSLVVLSRYVGSHSLELLQRLINIDPRSSRSLPMYLHTPELH
jgi:hypothetical protein